MISRSERLGFLESFLGDEQNRGQEEFRCYDPYSSCIGWPPYFYMKYSDDLESKELAGLANEYRRLVSLVVEKHKDLGVSPTPLSIQLKCAAFYAGKHPELLARVNKALAQYAAGEAFDINDIIRFVDWNSWYCFDSVAACSKHSHGQALGQMKMVHNSCQHAVANLLFMKFNAYMFDGKTGSSQKLATSAVKGKFMDFYDKCKWASIMWGTWENMICAYYRWRRKVIKSIVSCLKQFQQISSEEEKELAHSCIVNFLIQKRKKIPAHSCKLSDILYPLEMIMNVYDDIPGTLEGVSDGVLPIIKSMHKFNKDSLNRFRHKLNAGRKKRAKKEPKKAKKKTKLARKLYSY